METTKKEKLFYQIAIVVAAILIVIVILVNIPWGGEKAKIRKEYDSLTGEHIFEYITMKELKLKIENMEEFQLYIGKPGKTANQFVYDANDLAMTEYSSNIKVIYYFKLDDSKTTQDDIYFLEDIDPDISFPTLVYYKKMNSSTTSRVVQISALYGKDDTTGNIRTVLKNYFVNCYND